MKRFPHVYPGRVTDVHDPMRAGRVRVRIPSVLAKQSSPWANVLLPPTEFSTYREGDLVSVTFREGNPRYPVVLGKYIPYDGEHVADEFSAFTLETYQDDSKDARDHTSGYDNLDHRKGAGHVHPPYWNPNVGGRFWPLGARWFVSEEPGNQGMTFLDRIGQLLRFRGDPTTPLDPHDETRVGGTYTAPGLDSGSEVAKEGWRAMLELLAAHGQSLIMRVRNLELEEEVELRSQNPSGTHAGRLLFSNSLLQFRNLLERLIPGRTQHYEQVEDPDDPAADYQRMYDWHGNQVRIHSNGDAPDRYIQLQASTGARLVLTDLVGADQDIVELRDGLGNRLRIEDIVGGAVVDRILLQHHNGQQVEMLIDGSVIIRNDTGQEQITMAPAGGGIAITSAGGVTINGLNVVVDGDTVASTPGDSVGDTGDGTVTGSGGV